MPDDYGIDINSLLPWDRDILLPKYKKYVDKAKTRKGISLKYPILPFVDWKALYMAGGENMLEQEEVDVILEEE